MGGNIQVNFKRLFKEKILIPEPDIQSRGSLILLKRDYAKQDKDFPCPQKVMRTFKRFVKEEVKLSLGNPCCRYCGIEFFKKNNRRRNRMTVDHIISIRKGGSMLDFDNLILACYKCNTEKGEKSFEEFVNKNLTKD